MVRRDQVRSARVLGIRRVAALLAVAALPLAGSAACGDGGYGGDDDDDIEQDDDGGSGGGEDEGDD